MHNSPPPGHTRRRWIPWVFAGLVLTTGITSTWAYWVQTERQTRAALDMLFRADSERVRSVIAKQLGNYQVAIRGLQGFFHGSEQVYYEEFITYIPSLHLTEALRGVQAVGFAMPVRAVELAQHIEDLRAQLSLPYRVHPPPEAREQLAPIVFIDPLEGPNRAALGFDIFSNRAARRAAEQARDTGELVISEPLALVQDANGAAPLSFVMYLPVYRETRGLDSVAARSFGTTFDAKNAVIAMSYQRVPPSLRTTSAPPPKTVFPAGHTWMWFMFRPRVEADFDDTTTMFEIPGWPSAPAGPAGPGGP